MCNQPAKNNSASDAPFMDSEKGIVAYASGGQANATQLTKENNIIETVATALDSVKCFLAVEDLKQVIHNKSGGGNKVNIYPTEGDKFYGKAIDEPIALSDGGSIEVYCYEGEEGILRYN